MKDFLDRAKKAVLTGNSETISTLFDFTHSWGLNWHSGKNRRIKSKSELIKDFRQIMTPETIKIILNANMNNTDEVGCKGFIIDNGRIWFRPKPELLLLIIRNEQQ